MHCCSASATVNRATPPLLSSSAASITVFKRLSAPSKPAPEHVAVPCHLTKVMSEQDPPTSKAQENDFQRRESYEPRLHLQITLMSRGAELWPDTHQAAQQPKWPLQSGSLANQVPICRRQWLQTSYCTCERYHLRHAMRCYTDVIASRFIYRHLQEVNSSKSQAISEIPLYRAAQVSRRPHLVEPVFMALPLERGIAPNKWRHVTLP